jgi:hypothetical protein
VFAVTGSGCKYVRPPKTARNKSVCAWRGWVGGGAFICTHKQSGTERSEGTKQSAFVLPSCRIARINGRIRGIKRVNGIDNGALSGLYRSLMVCQQDKRNWTRSNGRKWGWMGRGCAVCMASSCANSPHFWVINTQKWPVKALIVVYTGGLVVCLKPWYLAFDEHKKREHFTAPLLLCSLLQIYFYPLLCGRVSRYLVVFRCGVFITFNNLSARQSITITARQLVSVNQSRLVKLRAISQLE